MKRRQFLGALGGAAAWPLATRAQQAAKVPRIGFLIAASVPGYASLIAEVRAGLSELGYLEGKSIRYDYRYADGRYDRLPSLATELLDLGVDVLVTHGTPGTHAAKRATAKIPIVMAVSGDALATGLVANLARPGGNVTGTSYFSPELAVKRLELLMEALPSVRRLGVLYNPENPISERVTLAPLKSAVASFDLELHLFHARAPAEFEGEFVKMSTSRVEAVALLDDGVMFANARGVAQAAAKHRVPSTGFPELATAGGLIGYGVDLHQAYRRTPPAELPVERSVKFRLSINLRTAKTLGIAVPPTLLARADEVIE